MSNQSNNNNWKLIAGLAGGAALGWWLNTDDGRKFRKEAQVKLNKFGNEVSEITQDQYAAATEGVKSALESGKETLNSTLETGKKTLNSTIETGKSYAETIAAKAKTTLNTGANKAENAIDGAETAFERGASKAQANIKHKATLAQKVVQN